MIRNKRRNNYVFLYVFFLIGIILLFFLRKEIIMFFFVPKEIRNFNKEAENRFGISKTSSLITDTLDFLEYSATFVVENKEKPLKFFEKAVGISSLLGEIRFVAFNPFDARNYDTSAKELFTADMYNKIGRCWEIISNETKIFFKMVVLKIYKKEGW